MSSKKTKEADKSKGTGKTASKKGNTFRGGSKSSRDKWYWHDIEDKEMADEVWQEWVDLGKKLNDKEKKC